MYSLTARGESRRGSRGRDLGSLARHEEESMQWHRRRRVTPSSGHKPLPPLGLRQRWSSAALRLLDDATASPASATPCIRPNGARNAACEDFHHGLLRLVVFLVVVSSAVNSGLIAQRQMNLDDFKRDSRIFESILGEVLKQNFSDFSIASDPHVSYLPGYGAVTTFYLKINRLTIRTPFGSIERPRTATSRTKQEQIRTVKETMMQALADFGGTLKGLSSQDQISISARIEDRNELDQSKNQIIVVLTVSRDDIDLYNMRKISLEDFKKRIQILEY